MANVTEFSQLATTTEFSELARFSRPMMTAAAILICATLIVGVIGNVLTVIALIKNARIRTVAAAFIANLCVSDLLICTTVLPFMASQFIHGKWIHDEFLCSLVPLMRYGTVGVSLISVALISINRYILIAKPSVYPRIYTKSRVALMVAIVWIFSYGILLPTLLGYWGKFGMDQKLGTCSIKQDENGHSSKNALFVLGFALPCTVIVVCYVNIYLVVRKSHKRLQQHGTNVDTKKSEWHITKMVLVIFCCFISCYLPLTLLKIFDSNVKYPPLHVVAYILFFLSACLNPIIYVSMNKQYRQAYLHTLRCSWAVSQAPDTPVPNSKTHMSVVFLKNTHLNLSMSPDIGLKS